MSHIQEIEKLFSEKYTDFNGISAKHDSGCYYEVDCEEIKQFLRSSHLKYLTNKRKELEGEIETKNKLCPHEQITDVAFGYNLAKQEEIDKLSEEIKNI